MCTLGTVFQNQIEATVLVAVLGLAGPAFATPQPDKSITILATGYPPFEMAEPWRD
ncbi:hypothetical protein [Roseibium sediminicola]|uniref:Amino acid ABC transporter n=1 Tax=Roseibium sediminicola TaxID=2933272 RepID=A0ABT0GS63_9HYPH|nr:hypothetical protein [Roseibium sp. CAU 1639]MCK7612131.1 hypothetical protein [Roseibium sp. CAU 1639]